MKRACELAAGPPGGEERDAGAGVGDAAATVRVANVIATASGAAHAGQYRLLSGASAPHVAQPIITCILSHSWRRSRVHLPPPAAARSEMTSVDNGSLRRNIGIDFGTTNSTIAVATGSSVEVAQFSFFGAPVDTFRSVLFFEHAAKGAAVPQPLAGPMAIERYLEPHEGGRLIQSLKSFAASGLFRQTQIGARQYTLEQLMGTLLTLLRAAVEQQLGPIGNRAVVGRPVRFVGANSSEDESRAISRLRQAYALAGFDDIIFQYEPIGAAYSYAQRLKQRELVLIADFGGGTSDFSVVWLSPGNTEHQIVATAGVPIGGDTFDARIIRRLVSPILGSGTSYRSVGKILPMPESLYRKLESWHHLSFLRSGENLRNLQSIRAQSLEPEKIDRLLEVVEGDLGYHLHQSVMRTKVELSTRDQAEFVFTDTSTDIQRTVTRAEFEGWIAGDLQEIRSCVGQALDQASVSASHIDRVFLTGGSSLLPALRRTFAEMFGAAKVASGDEFTSVARGLALIQSGHPHKSNEKPEKN